MGAKPIEDAFSAAGVRRVILSGVVLTVGVHPLIRPLATQWLSHYDVELAVLPLIEVIFLGLVISSVISQAYYLYEGFIGAFWTTPGVWFHTGRVRRLNATLVELESETRTIKVRRDRAIVFEKLSDYPLQRTDAGIENYVEGPTLLSNIIATYELYPSCFYGVDGIFFWHHILALAPDGIRAEFSEAYTLAESLVLASFAGVLVMTIQGVMLLALILGRFYAIGPSPVSAKLATALFLVGALSALVFYRLAVPVHREAGKIFRALVDLSVPKLAKFLAKTMTAVDQGLKTRSTDVTSYLGAAFRTRTAMKPAPPEPPKPAAAAVPRPPAATSPGPATKPEP